MEDLNQELWNLGVLAKTEHNEVAPAQHELAPIFTTTNIATDHNQLTMEIMQKRRQKARSCLPASRKALCRRKRLGQAQQLVYPDQHRREPARPRRHSARKRSVPALPLRRHHRQLTIIRICSALSVASAGNDHRLGANEAPPAVVSMFLGDELERHTRLDRKRHLLQRHGVSARCKLGVHVLPELPRDTTDRNRTSPVRIHRQQIRIPYARLVALSIATAKHYAQHHGRRIAPHLCR